MGWPEFRLSPQFGVDSLPDAGFARLAYTSVGLTPQKLKNPPARCTLGGGFELQSLRIRYCILPAAQDTQSVYRQQVQSCVFLSALRSIRN